MRHFWSIVNPSRPFKRLSPAIANTSQPAKRRKTFHRGDADTEDQRPTTSYTTQMDDRDECQNSCHQVFLSHSGYQKSFVEQLFLDLQKENISCFFDKDAESLPKGEEFPSLIFKAARECRVGVVVLSDEFLSSKWPMLELCQFVTAKKSTNGKLKMLPVFFRLTPQSLDQKLQQKDSLKRTWRGLVKAQERTTNLNDWVDALKELRRINGVVYNEQESEVDYRARIVSSIRKLVPRKLPYDESYVQGKDRLRQEVARLFDNTPRGEDGVKMAGLYGVPGTGKTTLARVLCNFYSNDFDGRVLHVELEKQMPIETLKRALLILTSASEMFVNSITDIEEGWRVFNERMSMSGKTVFLAIDNISDVEDSINEAQRYLRAVRSAAKQSTILLTARSSSILRRFIPEGERSCMHVPSLTEEEAIPVLLHLTPIRVSNMSSEQQDIAKKCALKCSFSCHGSRYNHLAFSAYHPSALRAFGIFLYDSCPDLSRWIDIQNSSELWRSSQEKLFSIFDKSFERLSEDNKKIFMLLCLFLPESYMISKEEEAFNWLALVCDTKAEHIKFAINELKTKGFVEKSIVEFGNRFYIHDLYIEFAENKADGTGEWISLRNRLDIPASLQKNNRPGFLAMKFDNCHFQSPGFVNDELFRNVLVLHLQDMPQLKTVDLSPMRNVRSITIVGCRAVQDIRGLESLTSLVYFVVKGCSANVQFSGMEGLVALQHLQVDANLPETTTESSPLSWTSFPPLHSASIVGTIRPDHIEKATGRLDLGACSKLRTIKLKNCKNCTEICIYGTELAGLRTQALCSTLESRSLPKLGPAFSNLGELRLVGLHNLERLPNLIGLTGLRILQLMEMARLKELPTLTGLTALQTLWLEGMHSFKELPTLTGLTSLRFLQLKGMHSLEELPTLTGLTALQELQLEGMHSLKELPTLTGLTNLGILSLKGMHSLKELPTLTGLTKLWNLWLQGMHSLKELPTLAGLTNLWSLRLQGMQGMHSLKELPTLTGLTKFCHLQLEGMHSLKELPTLTGLTNLWTLQLEGMHSLKELPTLTGLTKLRRLWLDGMHSLKELPTFTGLTALQDLRLGGMHSLKELPTLTGLTKLKFLNLKGMHSLKELPTLTGLTALQDLELEETHSLKELPTLTGLTALKFLRFKGMHSLKELPTLTGLNALEYLQLNGRHSLKELPTLTGLTKLQRLWLDGMHSFKELPTLTGLTALQDLRLEGMHSLKEPPSLIGLTALEFLWLEGMHSLEELPTLTGLTALRTLCLEGMHSLKELPTLTGLTALQTLWLEGMHSLKELPTLTGLTALQDLRLEEGMHSLKEFPTLTGLTALQTLWLRGVHSLKELQDLRMEEMYRLRELRTLTEMECHFVDGNGTLYFNKRQ